MDLVEHEKVTLTAFIDIYSKRFTQRYIAEDIIHVIYIYHGLSQTAFILTINSSHRSSEIMKFLDIYNDKIHPINLYFISSQNSFSNMYNSRINTTALNHVSSQHVAHRCELPTSMKKICKQKYENKLCSDSLFDSNKWHLIFHFISDGPASVSALHPHLFQCKTNPLKYLGYNINIPAWKNSQGTRFIYNKTLHTVYKVLGGGIYALDFRLYYDDWKWNLWKNTDHIIEHGASLCMVDNDRFMAVINANGKESYLYALNETKLSIRLADACEYRCMDTQFIMICIIR